MTPGFWQRPLSEPWRATPLLRDHRGIEWEAGAQRRDPQRVRQRLASAIDHWIDTARAISILAETGRPPIPRPRLIFDLHGSAVAGMAVTAVRSPREIDQWIRINAELMQRYPVRMIQQTVPHEVAHLVVDWYLRRGVAAHGPEWSAVMVHFGRPPRPFHDMEARRKPTSGFDERSGSLFEVARGNHG